MAKPGNIQASNLNIPAAQIPLEFAFSPINFVAYSTVPDLPGGVATGATIAEVELQIREAIEFHLDGMREDGTPIPTPASRVEYVDIAA